MKFCVRGFSSNFSFLFFCSMPAVGVTFFNFHSQLLYFSLLLIAVDFKKALEDQRRVWSTIKLQLCAVAPVAECQSLQLCCCVRPLAQRDRDRERQRHAVVGRAEREREKKKKKLGHRRHCVLHQNGGKLLVSFYLCRIVQTGPPR